MSNGYHNSQTREGLKGGKGANVASSGCCGSMPLKEKTSFSVGVPGKTQAGNRSAGVPKVKAYPDSEGI